ncbi:aldo/keto reductase [Streptomyces ipomoeae]|uniref:Aldo/keto reductase n=1 Tax=Streptomyces ipomoeae TaxID=103232 RepID=A0AAE8W6A8_9ACTN|nr:aldo/keto reductase [Streptomyces ipomoeae]MDX2695080.1 aldo/keto reductase [Streptomyces ipomoeae]MDX2819723.1 aldo/keto reductase [Streptomyces ipomoeae]MDX2838099.1 aldo/keto reductase [Streptomyces ipomoeae]MDX2874725.1 aldo/keto reductase [Streptomyces ipomoeae]TQE38701.1 aldo/keto reductase [Streptomyces ipomoeae]
MNTWKALERIYAEGRAKAIGVSNFELAHLRRVFDETSVVPAVNVIKLHPGAPQHESRDFHTCHGIATWGWSALGRDENLLEDPVLRRLAEKHGQSPAQVVPRWHIQEGNIVSPNSATPARIKENIDIFDFELDAEDLAAIADPDTGEQTVHQLPEEFSW